MHMTTYRELFYKSFYVESIIRHIQSQIHHLLAAVIRANFDYIYNLHFEMNKSEKVYINKHR